MDDIEGLRSALSGAFLAHADADENQVWPVKDVVAIDGKAYAVLLHPTDGEMRLEKVTDYVVDTDIWRIFKTKEQGEAWVKKQGEAA